MKEMREGCAKYRGPHPSLECDDKLIGRPGEEEAITLMKYTVEEDILRKLYGRSFAYHPPPTRNENLNDVFTRSGKTYDPSSNPNDKITVIYDDSDDDVEEKAKEDNLTPSTPKQTELILIKAINLPLIDVLAGMSNYGKFLKELMSNKNKLEEIYATFLNEECSTIVQNKIPPTLKDLGSFLIAYTLVNSITCNALADLGASINLMRHSFDGTCFDIDVIDEIKEDELDALLNDSDSFMSSFEKINETDLDRKLVNLWKSNSKNIMKKKSMRISRN
nr:hypothetical protein [Tanacetum cinerariifolium]